MDIIQITKKIPVVINNRNRFTTTKKMVDKLLSLNDDENIIILDNGSEYPPLLQWYEELMCSHITRKRVHIMYLPNLGHLALWEIELQKYLGDYFVYTDSDLELNNDFPKEWKTIMLNTMFETNVDKISLGIKIDDLPDHYLFKDQVIKNESRWWQNQFKRDYYFADTDTTFSLLKNKGDNQYQSVRICTNNMLCRHIPWYLDLVNLDSEEIFYLERIDHNKLTQYTIQHKTALK